MDVRRVAISRKTVTALVVAVAGVGLVLASLALAAGAGWRLFTVATPSMGVAAPVGTLVVTQPDPSGYRVGDVVAFHRGARIYTHRIIETLDGGARFVTKGDRSRATGRLAAGT